MLAYFRAGFQSAGPLLLGLALLLSGSLALAGVEERLDYRYYEVPAQPGESLRQAINRYTPVRQDGKVFHGYTRWQVRWRFYWFQEASGRCRMERVQVNLESEITLPRLSRGDASQQRRFTSYLEALRRHELGHVDLGRQAAHAIDRHLAGLPPQPDCASLETRANAGGMELLRHFQARERQFDRDTGHGRSQGAYLED